MTVPAESLPALMTLFAATDSTSLGRPPSASRSKRGPVATIPAATAIAHAASTHHP
jgi:hypothetical protein